MIFMLPELKVKINKAPIPIVWLDTSIINYIVKWRFKIGNDLEEIAIITRQMVLQF